MYLANSKYADGHVTCVWTGADLMEKKGMKAQRCGDPLRDVANTVLLALAECSN